jgi:hypothetical protein
VYAGVTLRLHALLSPNSTGKAVDHDDGTKASAVARSPPARLSSPFSRHSSASNQRWSNEHEQAVRGDCFLSAIAVAREQSARLWELRATASLARHRADRGEPAEASNLLMPLYGWFTEGFDSPDLRDAKALLDELT